MIKLDNILFAIYTIFFTGGCIWLWLCPLGRSILAILPLMMFWIIIMFIMVVGWPDAKSNN